MTAHTSKLAKPAKFARRGTLAKAGPAATNGLLLPTQFTTQYFDSAAAMGEMFTDLQKHKNVLH